MTLWIGIDPGLNGALGWFIDDGGGHAGLIDAPTARVKVGGILRQDYIVGAMAGQVAELCAQWQGHEPRAAIERVHAMPAQGVASMFKLGRGAGIWEGILAALQIPYDTVEPARWKKAVGLAVRAEKGESRVLATMQFPQLASEFVRINDDGRAEAILIARYARLKETRK